MQAPQLSSSNLHIRIQQYNSIHAITIFNINIKHIYKFTTNNRHLAYSYQYQQHHHKSTTSYDFSQSKQRRKVHHIVINIMFNIYKSFIHLHTIISNYSQKICKTFSLKIIFDKVRLSFSNFKTIETIEPKPSKQTLVPQLCKHLGHI